MSSHLCIMFMIDLNPRAGVEEWRGLSDWLDVCLLLDLCLNKSSACWSEFERVASGFSLNIYIMLKLFRDSLWPPYERLAFWFGLHIPGSSAGVNVKWFLEMEEASYPSIPTFKLAVIIYSSFIWYDIHLVEFRIFVLLFCIGIRTSLLVTKPVEKAATAMLIGRVGLGLKNGPGLWNTPCTVPKYKFTCHPLYNSKLRCNAIDGC